MLEGRVKPSKTRRLSTGEELTASRKGARTHEKAVPRTHCGNDRCPRPCTAVACDGRGDMNRTSTSLVAALCILLVPTTALAQSRDSQAGRELFEANCAMCHGEDAEGMMGMHPSLRGAVERLTIEGVEVTIRKGRDTQPPMPSFENRLTTEEIEDIVAYLDTLPVGPRNFGGESGMMDMDGMMGGGMIVGMIVFLVLFVAVIAGLVFALSRLRGGSGGARSSQADPLAILKERCARGEIDHDEFEERRRVLQQ